MPFVWPAGSGPCSSWRALGGVPGYAEAAQCPAPPASILPVEGQGWKADLQAEEGGAEISPQGGSQLCRFRSVTLSGPTWLSSQCYPHLPGAREAFTARGRWSHSCRHLGWPRASRGITANHGHTGNQGHCQDSTDQVWEGCWNLSCGSQPSHLLQGCSPQQLMSPIVETPC